MPSKARAQLQQAMVASDFGGVALTNLGTAGTLLPIPAGAHSVQIWGAGRFYVAIGSIPGVGNGIIPGSSPVTFGLHAGAGSIGLAAVSGSANVDVTYIKAGYATGSVS